MVHQQILAGLQHAFIDDSIKAPINYMPDFVSNDYTQGKKVLSTLESELKSCDEFLISVAFITQSGVTPLLQTLGELEQKGIKGKILTTNYLCFSEPAAIEKLASFTNIEVKMYLSNQEGFHTKGYIFKQQDVTKIIIGSSNLTISALTKNKEWNCKIISSNQGAYTKLVEDEFTSLWNSESAVCYEQFIDDYTRMYEQQKIQRHQNQMKIQKSQLVPNKMQQAFIDKIRVLRNNGENRALLLSATGTGKTYAAAFLMADINPKRILFIVHREQILKQAIKSFKRVFGKNKTMGLLSGSHQDIDCDFIFGTMNMLAKETVQAKFDPSLFDTIIIDEAHRVGSSSYKKIMNYFTPNFYLGMTASPERTDGFDIYSLFDHNIAYEIRLQQALQEDLLCPFHYFGITDIEVDGQVIDDTSSTTYFNHLVCSKRVNFILEKMKYYGFSGPRVKGLIFCSTTKEAFELSKQFNNKGLRTQVLTGQDSQETRELVIERLTSDCVEDHLDYIFTVDIFNEGVDIPQVNQVILLRPTQSPIVFVQQLGRGLRKYEDKEFVVILDFIGNYQNNFMIPLALSGDRSYNKDTIRKYVVEGDRTLPGYSTIHFDEIAKKRIFDSIDATKFSTVQRIKEGYFNLKYKLGKIPGLLDFEVYDELDVQLIFSNKLASYHNFLKKYEPDYTIELQPIQEKMIEFLSVKLANGKRVEELEFLKLLVNYDDDITCLFKDVMSSKYGKLVDHHTITTIYHILSNQFLTGSSKYTYQECIFVEKQDNKLVCSSIFKDLLQNKIFKDMVIELLDFGFHRYQKLFENQYKDSNFTLYQKYTYEDICRLLNWKQNEVPLNIGGYKFDHDTNTFPIFINYQKDKDIQSTINYHDRFISTNRIIAISKQKRTLESDDVQRFIQSSKNNTKVDLFVRKNKDDHESKEFYYLGRVAPSGDTKEFIMPGTTSSAVEIEWVLDQAVREDLYDYLCRG